MKAPYYYQLALWLGGSNNERTNRRTLRYHIPRMFFFVGSAERPDNRALIETEE